MTYADRLHRWNLWYDRAPEQWRFQLVVWALVAVGAANMLLTIAVRFPFGLLLMLAIAAIAAVRVPHALGWVKAEGEASAAGGGARLEIAAPSWVLGVNRWYDGLPEHIRPFVLLAALAVPGAINMALTMFGGFPFGLLFLLAVLAVTAIRAPYAAGWVKETPAAPAPHPSLSVAPPAPRIGVETSGASLADAPKPAETAPSASGGARNGGPPPQAP